MIIIITIITIIMIMIVIVMVMVMVMVKVVVINCLRTTHMAGIMVLITLELPGSLETMHSFSTELIRNSAI